MAKYGLVILFNPDGSLKREFRITEAEYLALGQKGAGAPPGVTDAEWQAKRVLVMNKAGREIITHCVLAVAMLKEE